MSGILDQYGNPWTPPADRSTGPVALSGSFKAARRDRLRNKSLPTLVSGRRHRDQVSLERLTRECQDTLRNDRHARALVAGYLTMVVGADLPIEPLTPDEAWNKEVGERFAEWADCCDETQTRSLTELAGVAVESWMTDGCALVRRVNGRGRARRGVPGRSGVVQLIEGVRLKNPAGRADTEHLAAGVEFDRESGEIVTYHVGHWEDYGYLSTETEALDARWHTLCRDPMLPGGAGGGRPEPRMASVLHGLEDVQTATEATNTAYILATMVALFIATEFPEFATSDQLAQAMVDAGVADSVADAESMGEWAAGTIMRGRPGESVTQVKPEHPTQNFMELSWMQLQTVGAALRIPPEVAFYRFIKNFSASRSTLAIFWEDVERAQAQLRRTLLSPVYRWWLGGEIQFRGLRLPDLSAERGGGVGGDLAMFRHRVRFPTLPVLDPSIETRSLAEGVAAGFVLPEEAVARMGGDAWPVHLRKFTRQYRELVAATGTAPGAKPVQVTKSETDGGGGGDGKPRADDPDALRDASEETADTAAD